GWVDLGRPCHHRLWNLRSAGSEPDSSNRRASSACRTHHRSGAGAEGRRLMNSRWMKVAQAAVLAVAVCFSLGATDANARYYDLNHRMMCTCGCAQLAGECNHVGCTQSGEELALLRTDIASGMTDSQIFAAFSAKYGA